MLSRYEVTDDLRLAAGLRARHPLTYQVDALRALMLAGGASTYSLQVDLLVLIIATVALIILGGRLHPRVVR